jgi:hypothetical protein
MSQLQTWFVPVALSRGTGLGSCGSGSLPRRFSLYIGMENPVKAALRVFEHPLSSKIRNDLLWRQRCVLGLVAGEQDPLAFLLAEPVGYLAGAAFTAISSVPICQVSLAPACCICLCNQIICLTPMGSTGQPYASSEQ